MSLYNRLHELFEYSDGWLFRKISVRGAPAGKRVGNKQSSGYLHIIVDGKKILAHRAIFLFFNGYLPEFLDHIDGDKENNLIANLRPATKAQNGHNRKVFKNSKSGLKNIKLDEKSGNWMVTLRVNKKPMYFGMFKDLELAALVAHEAREKFHGEFANHGVLA
jgi:hypothetical protein